MYDEELSPDKKTARPTEGARRGTVAAASAEKRRIREAEQREKEQEKADAETRRKEREVKAAAKVKEEQTLARAAAKKIKAAERAAAKAKAEEEQEAEEEEEEEEDYLTTWRELSAVGWTYARGSFLSSVSGQPSDYVWLRPGRKKENIGSTNCIENRDYFFDEKSVLAFVKVSWAINTMLFSPPPLPSHSRRPFKRALSTPSPCTRARARRPIRSTAR